MYDKIVFYNHFGNGDIFESREFVKEIYKTVDAKEYIYSHGKNHRLLLDMPFLEQDSSYVATLSPRDSVVVSDNTMYINTWIGRDSSYVLPGIGCTVEMLCKMYKDMGFTIRYNPYYYIPRIDFTYYNTRRIATEMQLARKHKKVLISNGNVQSCQADNFPFEPIINRLAEKYPDVLFYITSAMNYSNSNIIETNSITDCEGLGSDLNEIAYLSTYCDLIVGRSSGPFVFAQNFDNVFDFSKTFLAFTYMYSGGFFLATGKVNFNKLWSDYAEEEQVFKNICGAIDGQY